MRKPGHDIITLLEEERLWHMEQLRLINEALDVLKGRGRKKERREISWSRELDNILQASERPLSMTEIRDKFVEKGIPEAKEKRYYNTIFATLKRKIKQGKVKKTEDGKLVWVRKLKKE